MRLKIIGKEWEIVNKLKGLRLNALLPSFKNWIK